LIPLTFRIPMRSPTIAQPPRDRAVRLRR
jgi:hypothetical protein